MNFKKHFIHNLFFLVSLLTYTACSPNGYSSSNSTSQEAQINPNPEVQDPGPDAYTPLTWEISVKDGITWSLMVYSIIRLEQSSLLNTRVTDIEKFCPRYDTLSLTQKTNFWGQLIAAVAKFESNWKTNERYQETLMGKDAVTGEQIASEGLLQLSYQDSKYTPNFCHFDWSKDKELQAINPKDPRKTIFDPYRNLRCGLAILAKQIRKKNAIAIRSGAYWSVLKLGNSHQKIEQIATMTKSLSFCQ